MEKKNNMATASMVMGILSIVLSCCCCMGFILGGLAVLFACLSKVSANFEGPALTGLITGIIGILLGIISFVVWSIIGTAGSLSNDIYGLLPAADMMFRGGLL